MKNNNSLLSCDDIKIVCNRIYEKDEIISLITNKGILQNFLMRSKNGNNNKIKQHIKLLQA